MPIYELDGHQPQLADTAYVADEATLIGRVILGAHASVWPGAVLRAEDEDIRIGEACNIQDGAVLHVDPGFPLTLGNRVTVGHQAMLHGCTVEDGALVGLQAVVLNGAVIGRDSLIGAGAVVTEGKVFPPRSLILGAPARVVRTLDDADIARLAYAADSYLRKSELHRTRLRRIR